MENWGIENSDHITWKLYIVPGSVIHNKFVQKFRNFGYWSNIPKKQKFINKNNLAKVEVLKYEYIHCGYIHYWWVYMSVYIVFSKDSYIKNRKSLIFEILWIICDKIEKYIHKMTKKRSFRKRFNIFSLLKNFKTLC